MIPEVRPIGSMGLAALLDAFGVDPDGLPTEAEMAARMVREAREVRARNYALFLAELPDNYRETSDALGTPFAALPALFDRHAACGALEYPVNADAFRATLEAPAGPLYLFGRTGSGKTRAALRRAARMILAGEVDGVDFVRFGSVARDYTRRGPDAFDAVRLRSRRLLIVDDLLNGQTIAARREPFAGDWFDLIESIDQRKTPCVLTGNRGPEGLAEWFERSGVDPESVVRRIGQGFRVLAF